MKAHAILPLLILTLVVLSCKGPTGPAGPQGPSGTGIEDLVNPAIQPKVIYTYPLANTEGPISNNSYFGVMVRFNKVMDVRTLTKAISFTSPGLAVFVDTSAMSTIGGDVFSFYPSDSSRRYYDHRWVVGARYTLAISSVAKDVNGNAMSQYSMSFRPEPYFRVIYASPSNNSSLVITTTSQPSLSFNSPVDTSISSAIQITPQLNGRWGYYFEEGYGDSSALYFSHNGLALDTEYRIVVNTIARHRAGNQLLQPFSHTFRTPTFKVNSIYPSSGSSYPLNGYIALGFTGIVDTGTIRSAFHLSPPTPGQLTFYNGSNSFDFRPSGLLLPDSTYTITVDTTLRSGSGLRLSEKFVSTFRTTTFRVSTTTPYNLQTGVSRATTIAITMNAPLDTSSIRSAFAMQGVAGTFAYGEGSPTFSFTPSSQLNANTNFVVTLSSSLRAKGSARLRSPYIFSFTTGN